MLQPLEKDTFGLIAAALVLGNAGSLAWLRLHLYQEIRSRLKINYTPSPTSSVEHREQIYDLFLGLNLLRTETLSSARRQRSAQRAILGRFLAGDVWDDSCVECLSKV
jgi:hypothetical protein